MDDLAVVMNTTKARATFKANAGQNNHFLITILVGLDAVREGTATRSETFATSWEPHDVKRSADRSREYVTRTSLVWITELVCSYRIAIGRMAGLPCGGKLQKLKSMTGGELARLTAAAKILGYRVDTELNLLRLAIEWRNRTVHPSTARPRISSQLASELRENAAEISVRHSGMDIEQSIRRFNEGKAPTFKDVASMMAASHKVVEGLDALVLAQIDFDLLADQVLREYLAQAASHDPVNAFTKLWPGSPEKTVKRLQRILIQSGFAPSDPAANVLSSGYVSAISALTVAEASTRFK